MRIINEEPLCRRGGGGDKEVPGCPDRTAIRAHIRPKTHLRRKDVVPQRCGYDPVYNTQLGRLRGNGQSRPRLLSNQNLIQRDRRTQPAVGHCRKQSVQVGRKVLYAVVRGGRALRKGQGQGNQITIDQKLEVGILAQPAVGGHRNLG